MKGERFGRNSEGPASLLQLCVLRLGFFQDGYVWIGVFPKREKVLVRGQSSDAGGIGIRALRCSSLQRVCPGQAEMRQRAGPTVPHDAAVVKNLLECCRGCGALSSVQICLTVNVGGIETGKIIDKRHLAKFDRGRDYMQVVERLRVILSIDCL